MSILRKLMLILPVALVFSATGWAQTSQFEGTVKGADGKPLPGAEIRIERQDVKGNYKTKTDKKGHYFYGGLPLGNYKITVATEGSDKDAQTLRSKLGETQDVSFDLAKSAAAAGGAAPPDESNRAESAADKAAREKAGKEQAAAMAKNKALNDAFGAGKTAAAASNWDGAIENFQKASELDPMQHVVWGNLADAYVSRSKASGKTQADREADWTKAGEAYQKAIAIKPDDAAYHNNYALVLANQEKFDDAQAELTKSATADPTNAGKYYFNLGAVYVNKGKTDPAAAAFKKAIDLDPNYAEAYYQYGLSLMGKATVEGGKTVAPAGTQEAFQKYLDLAPNGANAPVAKEMLTSLGATIDTGFAKPGQKAAPKQNKK